MNEYRAVYAKGPQCEHPAVSGIAWASNACVVLVPAPPNARYDDSEIHPSSFIEVSVLKPKPNRDNDDEDEQPWGFLVHDACWRLFNVACQPDLVNVPFLFQLMKSFPVSMLHVVYWGHDYGRVYDLAFPDRRAAEENDFEDYKMLRFDSYEFPVALRLHAWDPTSPTLVNERIERAQRDRTDLTMPTTCGGDQSDLAADHFIRLPPELREHILCQLPSSDVLSTLIASRSFHSIELSQTFWSSRFKPDFEFGHLFEALRQTKRSDTFLDYKALHDICRKHRVSRDHLCRKRVWTLPQPLARLIALYDSCQLSGDPVLLPGNQQEEAWRWASGVRSAESKTWSGGGSLQRRQVILRGRVKRVDVSLADFHALTFVTGICITYFDGFSDKLGYILPIAKCIFDATASSRAHGLESLVIGMGHMGVHGIGTLESNLFCTEWAGLSPTDCTIRNVSLSGLKVLQGQFDVGSESFRLPAFANCLSGVQAGGLRVEVMMSKVFWLLCFFN